MAYSADNRQVDMKVELYFNSSGTPETVTTSDYLVEANILEETGSGDDWVFGNVSSNELNLKLLNENGRYTPTNRNDIRTGMKIIPYFRVNSGSWTQMGVYYVEEWKASVTEYHVEVKANDILFKVLNADLVKLPVETYIGYGGFYQNIFGRFGITPNISDDITGILKWGYVLDSNAETIQKITEAVRAICSCDKTGNVRIRKPSIDGNPVATLTDDNQIINLSAEHNIKSGYTEAVVKYNNPTVSDDVEIYSADGLDNSGSVMTHDDFELQFPAVTKISSIQIYSEAQTIPTVDSYNMSSKSLTLKTNGGGKRHFDFKLKIMGTHIVENMITVGKEGSNAMVVENKLIQDGTNAWIFGNILSNSLKVDLVEMSVDIRGMPTLNVGDKVRIVSDRYGIDFTGYVKQAEYTYNGALGGKLKLVNSRIFGGV